MSFRPAALQYADGAWAIAYNDNAWPVPNLFFRRSLGGGDPQFWKDATQVEGAARSPALIRLGSTTALFYIKAAPTVMQVFVKTSTDDGATWSTGVQLSSGTSNASQVQVVDVAGTIHMFWSQEGSTGLVQYKTSTDLSTWSDATNVGQTVAHYFPLFDIKKLASGDWAMTWLGPSPTQWPSNNNDYSVVWFARSSSLTSTTWSNKQELSSPWIGPLNERFPGSVSLAQASSGELFLNFAAAVAPWDSYIFSRSSTNSGTSWAANVRVGHEPSRPQYGNGAVSAYNPFPVVTNSGTVRLFWDMEATPYHPGGYAPQLFRKDLPSGPIVQMSVTKEQMAKCGPCVPTGAFVADPINATTGNFTLPETDIAIPGKGLGLSFSRTFNAQRSTVDGPLGFGWTHDYDEKLTAYSRGEVLIIDGSGRNDLYTPKAGGGFDPPAGRFDTLVANVDGTFTLTDTGFNKKSYSADGYLTAITDRNNNTLTLGYSAGKLTTVTDSGSRTLSFAYSGTRISSITDPLSRTVSFGYSGAGDLTSVTDPRSKVWNMTYDADHRMLTKTDPNNRTVLTNVYTSLSRVLTQTDAKGGVTSFNYSAGGGQTDVTDPRGNITKYFYDPSYRVTRTDDPYGAVVKRYYDSKDNLERVEDLRRSPTNNTYFTYDSKGNVLTRKNGNNKTWTYTYNAFNQVLTETDPMNRTTTNVYDGAGNLTSTTNAKNQTTTFAVGAWGQITSVTDARSKTTSFGYDSYGNQTTVTNPLGKIWTTTYDLAGRKTKVKDPLNHESEFAYNLNDDLTSVTDARSKVTTFAYDNAGNRISTTDPNNKLTAFSYDEKNRLKTVTDAEAGVTTYNYDASDNLTSVVDAKTHTCSYSYDKNNLLLTEKDALNNTTTYLYDGAGNRTRRTDAKRAITNYGYDTIGRQTSISYPSPTVGVTYSYNDADAQTSMTDATGTTSYTLDELYRPSSITLPGSRVVGYLYDAAGNRTRITYPDARQVNYSFDDANRMATVTDWLTKVTTYGYDDAGRWITTTFPTGVVETKDYNNADQLTDITAVKGGTTLTDFTYGLDDAGMRTSVTTPAGLESYDFDDLYRLTGVTYPDATTQSYSYDAVGNRSQKTEGITPTTYVYDNADRMSDAGGVAYGYDNNGNQITRGADTFTWDIEDRMTGATVGGNAVSYSYRGDDLRHSKTQGAVTTTFTWDLSSELPVVLQEGTISYVYGLGLISQTTGTTQSYFLADGLGSTAALTDDTGTVTATYRYDVFGAVKAGTGTGSSDFRFAGQQDDPAVGFQYLRARYYDPAIGRFVGKDPLSGVLENPSSQNAFVYSENNPVSLMDPTGNMAEAALAIGAGTLTGIGLTALAPAIVFGATVLAVAGAVTFVGYEIVKTCNLAFAKSKHVPKRGVGGSGKARRHFVDKASPKAAKDAASEAGNGPPVKHKAHQEGQSGHFHPTDRAGNIQKDGSHFNFSVGGMLGGLGRLIGALL